VVERVADHAAPAEVGNREPEPVAACLDRLVEVEPTDARLDDRIAELLVDLEHAVHPAEVDDDRPAHPGRRAPVAVVAPDARDPDRHPVLVRDPQDGLDLLDAVRLDDRRGLVVVPVAEPERVPELGHVLLGREDVLGADDLLELAERGGEGVLGQRWGNSQGHGDLRWKGVAEYRTTSDW